MNDATIPLDSEDEKKNVTIPLDSEINPNRDRGARFLTLVVYILLVPSLTMILFTVLGEQFFPNSVLMFKISLIIGLAVGIGVLGLSIEKFFIIRNPTTAMFLTQDTIASLLGKNDVNISYGPGTHISFPWERRLGENNISLLEAANDFNFTVQCADGTLTGSGSFRVRPNQSKPVVFLSSVSAVADDIRDLIVGEVVAFFKNKTAAEALNTLGDLNKHLDVLFRQSDTEVEERCGVQISDVTVTELLPSEELQRTLSAVSEAGAIAKGVEILLGMNQEEQKTAIREGRLTQADINLARDRFLSISGNLAGMDIKRQEFDFSFHGLDPEALTAMAEVLKTPGGMAVATAAATSKRGGGSK
jgi:hypothetical protein